MYTYWSHEVPSSDLEFHSTNEFLVDTRPTSAYSFPLCVETTTKIDKSLSVDVDSDNRASLDVDGEKSVFSFLIIVNAFVS